MIPDFSIKSEAGDLTENFKPRLISLSVTDNTAEQADSCTIELANHDGKLIVPQNGHKLTVSMGYKGKLQELGTFLVDQVELSGPPDRVTISGKAAPFTAAEGFQPLQTRKSRSFDDITLQDLAETIALEAGLEPAIDPSVGSVKIPHVDQTSESDMNLLTRLCRDYQAVFKCADGNLVIAKRAAGTSVSGKPLPSITIRKSDCSSYSATLGKRTKFKKVTTKYHDPDEGDTLFTEDENENDDDGGADYEHPFPFADEDSAQQGAEALRDQLSRGAETVSVTIMGRPDISAEGNVKLEDFNERMNGEWLIKCIEHSLSKRGYATTIQGENSASRELDNVTVKKSSGEGDAFVE